MTRGGGEIARYDESWESQVVELLGHELWRGDPASHLAYFRWKYTRNPAGVGTAGVVALAGGRVVGFRGLFATRYRFGLEETTRLVFSPGDTCVDPASRGRGLSVELGRAARRLAAERSELLLNFSSTRSSLPGYLRLGYLPLAGKYPLIHGTPLRTLRYLATALAAPKRLREPAAFEAARSPRPALMAEIAAVADATGPGARRIAPVRDEAFYRWRFDNPLARYEFVQHPDAERVTAFAVVGRSRDGRRAHLLDLAGAGPGERIALLEGLLRRRRFDLLSIASYAVDDELRPGLVALGFRDRHPVRALERLRFGEPSLLLRSTVDEPVDASYRISGFDVRDPRSWALQAICSDAV